MGSEFRNSLCRSPNYNEGSDRTHPAYKAYVHNGIAFVIETTALKTGGFFQMSA